MIMPLIMPYARDLGASPTVAGLIGKQMFDLHAKLWVSIQLCYSVLVGAWAKLFILAFSQRQRCFKLCMIETSSASHTAFGDLHLISGVGCIILGKFLSSQVQLYNMYKIHVFTTAFCDFGLP